MSIRHQRLITESNSNIAKPLQHKAMENISLSLWPRDHPLVSKAFTAKLRNWLYSALKRPPLSQLPIGFAICKPLHMPRKVCVRDTRLCSKPSPFAPRLGDVLRVIPTRAYILVYQLTSSETFTLVYTLAFYLAFFLAFLCDIFSGILYGIHSGTLSDILSDIQGGIHSAIPTVIYSDYLALYLIYIPPFYLTGYLTFYLT